MATYLIVNNNYRIMPYGASIGYGYGPKLIMRKPIERGEIILAVPGAHTTARVLSEIYLIERGFRTKVIELPFDRIDMLVKLGIVDAGVLIHEAQMLDLNEHEQIDLGKWWFDKFSLPIPLGLNVIHKRINYEIAIKISEMFRESIEYSYENIEEALRHAEKYSRIKNRDMLIEFIKMYVKNTRLEKISEEIKSIIKLHELCKEYNIEPFNKSELSIEIVGEL